ncbi:MAG: SDR family oxidoreductase [Verrucomicrobia bacterium]|nr:SDR family oxidoreductase [Verrucomicrobiota bacterium]
MRNGKTNQVVVVTGASAGLGRAIAHAFAREGARIGLVARGRAGLEGAKREVQQLGAEAIVLPVDVADAKAVDAAAAAVEEQLGPIDVWVNNAMCSVFSPVKEMQPDEYKRVTEVTYLGFVYGSLAALKRMLPRDHGVIVQVGSALAYRGIPLQSAYCASKHAIQGFCDSLRSELLYDKSKVRVVMVQMPAMNTPQFDWVKSRLPHKAQPVPPIYQPEVAAGAVVYAAHNDRREVYVGGPTVEAIVGNKIAPAFADHYLAWTCVDAQQTSEPENPNRPNNLFEPVDDKVDHGTHGRFDSRSRTFSLQLWADKNRNWLAAAAIVLLGAGVTALMRREFAEE